MDQQEDFLANLKRDALEMETYKIRVEKEKEQKILQDIVYALKRKRNWEYNLTTDEYIFTGHPEMQRFNFLELKDLLLALYSNLNRSALSS